MSEKWRKFLELPTVERKIAVAKDIVLALKLKKLVEFGGWVDTYNEHFEWGFIEPEASKSCAACAIGAAYMCSIDFDSSKIALDNSREDSQIFMKLAGFTLAETYYIEECFEYIDGNRKGSVYLNNLQSICDDTEEGEYIYRNTRLLNLWSNIAESSDGTLIGFKEWDEANNHCYEEEWDEWYEDD